MAEIGSFASESYSSENKLKVAPLYSNSNFSQLEVVDHYDVHPYSASDDDIPTIDYSLLFCDDPNKQFHALECLRDACQEYGFFYVNLLSLSSFLER